MNYDQTAKSQTNTRTKYVLEWLQGMVRWFIMNEKQQTFDMIMMCKQSLINERVARHLQQDRGVIWHVVAGIPKFCAEFFFCQCATAGMFYKNNNDFLLHFSTFWYGLWQIKSLCTIKKYTLYLCRITRKDDMAKWMKKWSQICLTFNKITPAKDTLCKLDKQRFLSGSTLCVKQSERPVKNTDVLLIWRNQVFTLPEDP